jgi:hypothetical protein
MRARFVQCVLHLCIRVRLSYAEIATVLYVRVHARLARKEASDVRGQLGHSGLQLIGRDGHVQRESLLVRLFESAELMLQPEALADECSADRPRRVVDWRTFGQMVRGWERSAGCLLPVPAPHPLAALSRRSPRHYRTRNRAQ